MSYSDGNSMLVCAVLLRSKSNEKDTQPVKPVKSVKSSAKAVPAKNAASGGATNNGNNQKNKKKQKTKKTDISLHHKPRKFIQNNSRKLVNPNRLKAKDRRKNYYTKKKIHQTNINNNINQNKNNQVKNTHKGGSDGEIVRNHNIIVCKRSNRILPLFYMRYH